MITLLERFGTEDLRFRVAELIHKIRPKLCWGDLALWALFPENHQFYDVWRSRCTRCHGCGRFGWQ